MAKTWRGFIITQDFGYKNPKYKYRLGYHPGTDLRFAKDSKQPAFRAGVARYQPDTGSGYGNTGTITLSNGDVLLYAHLKKNGILVKSGTKVQEKQPVFVTGLTGMTDGYHAHVEYRIKGDQNKPVDITKKIPNWTPIKPAGNKYRVKAGDSLSKIASKFGTTWQKLWGDNKQIKNPNLIEVGQLISVPDKKKPAVKKYHVVKRGDTLGNLAMKYHTKVDTLVKWNNIKDKNKIFVGDKLRVK